MRTRHWMLGMAWMAAAVLALAGGPAAADDQGFVSLFDGKSLEGWDGDERFWRVEDGALTAESTAEKPCKRTNHLVWKGGQPADFELTADFKLSAKANSGIQVRSRRLNGHRVGGYQADMTGNGGLVGFVFDKRGLIARRGEKVTIAADGEKSVQKLGDPKELLKSFKVDDWNTYRIVCRGPEITLYVNGTLMCQLTDNDAKMAAPSGIIALQMHGGPPMKVQFKNIRLKEDAAPSNPTSGNPTKRVALIAGGPSHGYGNHEQPDLSRLLTLDFPFRPSKLDFCEKNRFSYPYP